MKTGPLHCFGFECVRSIGEDLDRLHVDALYADFGKECGLIKAARHGLSMNCLFDQD
ncbi:hypothetical protein ACXHXN_24675 [Rhizobium sp. LEGMi135b]